MSKTIKFAGVLAVAAAALQLAAGLAQANPAAQWVRTVDEATVSASRPGPGGDAARSCALTVPPCMSARDP